MPPVLLRAGAASRLDPFPTARGLTQHQVTTVYVLYGGAAAVTVVLLVFAAWRVARRRGGGPGPVAAQKVPEESVR